MLVIRRNGRTIVLTGWRAWLVGAVMFVLAALLVGFVAFVLLGIAVTVGAVMLILVPIAIGIALISSLFRSTPPR
jgi:hypothetical protein